MCKRYCYLILLVIVLTACTPIGYKSQNCSDISAPALRSLIGKSVSPAQMLQIIVDLYQLSSGDIQVQEGTFGSDYIATYEWTKNGVRYSVETKNEMLYYGRLSYEMNPSFTNVIACIGKPKWYRAWYGPGGEGGNRLDFEVFFPDQGVVVRTWQFENLLQKQPPHLNDNTPARTLVFVLPGSVQEIVEKLLDGKPSDGWFKEYLRELQPWPGNVDKVTIEIDSRLWESPPRMR